MVIHEIANALAREEEEKLARAFLSLLALALLDNHGHKCGACGHEWQHMRPTDATDEEYAEAHRCPECREGPWLDRTDDTQVIEGDDFILIQL